MRIVTILMFVVLLLYTYPTLRVVEFFQTRDPILEGLKKEMSSLHPRFQDVELYVGDKSYTINKERVYVCMKDSDGRYYDRNMLVYVLCHEYAHVLCTDIGHTDQFFSIFDKLLQKAAVKGIYDPNIPPVKNYCGHD
jgi:hypothetical protein